MMAVAERRFNSRFRNFRDVLDRLGDVPWDRVFCQPAPGTAVYADLFDAKIVGDRCVEFVDGILVAKSGDFRNSGVAARISYLINRFATTYNLGAVAGPDGPMKLRDHLLRSPDVSFIRWDSVLDPEEIINPRTGWCNYPPDLAVEVLSPSNTEKEMRIKLDEYVRAGVKIVWIVDPERQEVDVYTRPRFIAAKTYRLDDHLDGGKVLPGFILRVSDIFKTPTPPKKAKKNGR